MCTLPSTNIAGWKMDPLIEDVFPIENWRYFQPAYVSLPEDRDGVPSIWMFPKMVGFPNNHGVFLLQIDPFWGVKWGVPLFFGNIHFSITANIPSRELTYPTWGKGFNHRLKSAILGMGYVKNSRRVEKSPLDPRTHKLTYI